MSAYKHHRQVVARCHADAVGACPISTAQAGFLYRALGKTGIAHETWLLPAIEHGFGNRMVRAKINDFPRRC